MGKQVGTLKMTGSFAGAVGYIDKQGRVQMRSKAEAYHDANTIAQRKVRTKFLALTGTSKSLKPALIGLSRYAKDHKISLRNAFAKLNYSQVTTTVSGNDVTSNLDPTTMYLAYGELPGVSFGSPKFDEPLQVDVAWGANSDMPGASADDLVYIVVMNPGDGKCVLSNPVKRSVGTASVTVPNAWNGEIVKVYGFAQGFSDENDRITYEHGWLYGEAEAVELLSKADYSMSHYIGEGSIS